MALSLGVHVGQQNLEMDALRALWRKLDDAGVDWISAWDHLYEAPPQGGSEPHFEAATTLATLACETRQARIGCLVFYVGYRNPALLAKMATTLDHISGGRFELGLGAGWHIWEANAHGYVFPDIGTRLDMLEEGVQIVRGMLTQERTSFSGKHYQVDDVSCLPAPRQERLPIWIGGTGEKRTLAIAAEYADGWNAAYLGADEFARLSGVLNEWCDEAGRDPASIRRGINVMFNLATTSEAAAAQEASLIRQWGAAADRMRDAALLGEPAAAVEHLMRYVEAGADSINVALRAPWDEAALDTYLERVIPELRAAAS
ncbi:MAG: TIGR03560 family F420-dependent LLM class oxidoreductase [Pseudomonadota bacterium]